MKTTHLISLPLIGIALCLPSCVVRPGRPGPHVAVPPGGVSAGVAGVSVGVYDTLPPGYTSPYYLYGNRYYYGGRWEPGRFFYHGRHYDGRYFHNGRFIYGGRFHSGGPGPHRHHL